LSKQDNRQKDDAIQVDWIVLTVSALGLVVVIIASIQAGDGALAANLVNYMSSVSANG
jgi:hypothetical protein